MLTTVRLQMIVMISAIARLWLGFLMMIKALIYWLQVRDEGRLKGPCLKEPEKTNSRELGEMRFS